MTLTAADVDYIRANFVPREALRADLRAAIERGDAPAPSYVLDDGTEMYPPNLELFEQNEFERRYLAAGGDPQELEEDWEGYAQGIFGVCLREVTPETIVHKNELVRSLGTLLEEPRPDDEAWRERLRHEVDELDALEREFSPDYDRSDRFDRPPTRDLLIRTARDRYPDVFETRRVPA